MKKDEAISHIISSTKYWAGDTFDNWSYPNNLGLERAFEEAVKHVKYYHYADLDEEDIKKAKNILGIP